MSAWIEPPIAPENDVEKDPRWRAVLVRDREADGLFYFSVRTTRVYCRPSCASRLADPKNVRFHRTRAEAERAGFRPCRRCRPDRSPAQRRRPAGGLQPDRAA